MKYSMLSVAAFVASSLASPAYLRGEPEKPGPITVDNKLNTDVRLEIIPIQGHEFEAYDAYVDIKGGQAYTIEDLPPSADLKLRVLTPIPGQGPVDVIYRSLHPGPDSPFRYWINRGSPHFVFPGVVDVQPKPQTAQCYRLTSYPNRLLPPPPFCDAGTRLLITLCQEEEGGVPCPPIHRPPPTRYEAEWL
ncbi:hypothetical protein H634G_01230 [Metarhizium anisopliae BRIP 53293]|uniref:Uncharacterized protein n=1 Tax=Metarhizium anisopliae BRIP 53293 TaxID=1291518 RepID=A0A0D9PA27_METAN|nr:hypothetical protein H634G_01230 [Metarhizium anisopliae BRIP 53293]KJK87688.1 hypothetical protein H633G_08440 [Metarhizium anisopliae BRIP 53284]